ncbi:CAB45 protein, partial [Copsychus sechellarum]|nr:CAB45 protein [Copsychus sechellarum]
MLSSHASLCSLCPVLLILLLLHVQARPANNSVLKEKEEQELVPPDHLNGVKLELDGHLNRDFHQEVFLGRARQQFEQRSQPSSARHKLSAIFSRVDTNNDKKISAKEMQRWIMAKTDEHFQEAVEENKMHFRAVDPDGDGHVSWDEYKIKFLASKGFNEKEIAEKIKNNEELKIDEESKCRMRNGSENQIKMGGKCLGIHLNIWCFSSPDQDGDKKLTLSEFISLPVGTVENQQAQDIDDDWVRDRRKEFQEVIDANHDGIVTMEELE